MTLTMSRWVLVGALALGAVGATFGLTPGVPTADAAPSVSPFAGYWSGTFARVVDPSSGTVEWTISHAGRITGRGHNDTSGYDLTFVGHVGGDGHLMVIGFQEGGESGAAFQGEAVIDDTGTLVAHTTATWDSTNAPVWTLSAVE